MRCDEEEAVVVSIECSWMGVSHPVRYWTWQRKTRFVGWKDDLWT